MLMSVFTGAPVWVWPLLAGLLALGLHAARDRESPVLPFYLLPLLGVLSLATASRMSEGWPVWLGFGAAYAVGAMAGYRMQGRWIRGRMPGRVALRGEWVTLSVIMLLFWTSFGWNVAAVLAPQAMAALAPQLVWAVLAGLAAGSLPGRGLRVARMPATPVLH